MDYRTMDDVELSILINQAKGLPRNHALSKFYASDMNAAVALLREMAGQVLFNDTRQVWACFVQQGIYFEGRRIDTLHITTEHSTNPARAIAECWLIWKDGHG